jgi:putative transposase
MLVTLKRAQKEFNFKLLNFCIMPNHIHLLIKPENHNDLPRIIQWIKTNSAKWWNKAHESTGHIWGERFFSRIIRNTEDYVAVMEYIDYNPIKAGLATTVEEWKKSRDYKIVTVTDSQFY